MSRHTLVLRQRSLGQQTQSMEEIIRKIAKTRPDIARKMAAIDWNPVIMQVASETLAAAATEIGCLIKKSYDNANRYGTESGDPPNGSCIGVLYERGGIQLGLALDGTNIHVFWNTDAQEKDHAKLQLWQQTVERIYKERSLTMAMQFVGGPVHRETLQDGTVVLTSKIKAVLR